MTHLLRKPLNYRYSPKVTMIHSIQRNNSCLEFIELQIIDLAEAAVFQETTQELELCCVVMAGQVDIQANDQLFSNLGTRKSVFDRIPTDSLYLGINQEIIVNAKTDARILLAYTPTKKELPHCLIPANEVMIEERGKYQNQRTVHNILTDRDTVSDKLLVVEVYTEAGNFSSYPPHKHDREAIPEESRLEETYYHEINPQQGFVFQRVYTDDRLLDQTMAVENADVVLVPKGYHPVGVPDGYTSYYLNVMAGPVKAWNFYDDPDHKWILERE